MLSPRIAKVQGGTPPLRGGNLSVECLPYFRILPTGGIALHATLFFLFRIAVKEQGAGNVKRYLR
jgi:hypothetical protein